MAQAEYIWEPSHKITERTISEMHKLIRKAKIDPKIQKLVASIVKDCEWKDYWCEANTVFNFSKKYVRYVRDPDDVELLQSVWKTLERQSGDCDDGSILVCGMLASIGFPYRFITLKASKSRPTEWSHVYPEIKIPNHDWVGADWSVPEATLGWTPTRYFEKKIWNAPKEK